MRVLAILAFGAFSAAMLAGNGAAMAADCSKGMMWPYVRAPGDCLTDAEIQAGKSGVYTGLVDTNPDLADIKPNPAAAAGASAPSSDDSSWFWPFGGSDTGPGTAPSPAGVANARGNGAVQCSKGSLWPFVRDPGDCLTDNEKKSGQKGVYGGGSGIPATATAANSTPVPAGTGGAPAASASDGSAGAQSAAAPAPATPACTKGAFWPFIRRAGDCPTDSEKK